MAFSPPLLTWLWRKRRQGGVFRAGEAEQMHARASPEAAPTPITSKPTSVFSRIQPARALTKRGPPHTSLSLSDRAAAGCHHTDA
jgi:hypothetical protein